jgi:hypothetical protein
MHIAILFCLLFLSMPCDIRSPIISGFGGIRFPHIKRSDSLSSKDYLILQIIFVNNLGTGPGESGRKNFKKQIRSTIFLSTKGRL